MEENTLNNRWETRMNEAYSLGTKKGKEALEKLFNYLNDKEWKVRRAAVESLGTLRDISAIPVLTRQMTDDAWQVRQGTAFALGYLSKETQKMDKEGDASLKDDIKTYLEESLKVLTDKLTSDTEWRVRQACASSLRAFKRESVSSHLINALKDPDWHVQCTSAESLGDLKDPAAKKHLKSMLKGADPMSRKIINNAVDKIEGKQKNIEGQNGKPILSKKISRDQLLDMKKESGGSCSGCTPIP